MNQLLEPPDVRADVIEALRDLARRGTTVRELVRMLQTSMDLDQDSLLTILWYFMKAFCLPLGDVLPIREWLGTDRDEEIDAAILPAIKKTMGRWSQLRNGTLEGIG